MIEKIKKMKKISFVAVFILLSVFAKAQVEFGVQFSPTLSTTRFESKTDAFSFDNYKSGIRFNTGLVLDFFIRENVAISTGLWYSVKRSGITYSDTSSTDETNTVTNTQYLNLPISIKFYTQEIIAGSRLFLQLGGVADFKISGDKVKIDGSDLTDPDAYSKIFNTSLQVSLGMEKKLGNNKVFGSIFYNRGLINMMTKEFANTPLNNENLSLNSDQIGLTMGYKF